MITLSAIEGVFDELTDWNPERISPTLWCFLKGGFTPQSTRAPGVETKNIDYNKLKFN